MTGITVEDLMITTEDSAEELKENAAVFEITVHVVELKPSDFDMDFRRMIIETREAIIRQYHVPPEYLKKSEEPY